MAVSNATSSTASTGKGIDVATIVSGLMDVERAPVTKLQTQIDQKTLVISTLGVFKSKVSALESAAKAIQTPGVFSLRSASSSDSTKVSATASNAASTGTYSVKVAQTAQAQIDKANGFTSASAVMDLSGFSLTVGGTTYEPRYAKLSGSFAGTADSVFASGDVIRFTLKGGKQQSFTVTSQTTSAAVATAINSAVSSGTLTGVTAYDSGGKLVIASANPLQGISAASHEISDYQEFGETQTFAVGDVIKFAVGSGAIQTYTVKTATTVADVATEISAAVEASSLSGVTASVVGGKLRIAAKDAANTISQTTLTRGAMIASAVTGYSTRSTPETNIQDGLSATATIANLKDWINALDVNIEANLVQVASNNYTLILASTVTGASKTFSVAGLKSGETAYATSTLQAARDAFFSINGLAVQRSSNEINDVVNGVTFNLNTATTPVDGTVNTMPNSSAFDALSTTTVNVTAGTQDLATSAVTDFVAAYNELLSFYKEQSASSIDAKKRGVLNTDSSLRSYMERLRSLYGKGVRLADGSTMNFNTMGVEVQRDGSLYLDKGVLNTAVANGLQNKFADGVTLGYESATSSFTSFLTSSLKPSSGLLTTHIKDTENQQSEIQKKIDDWEVRLSRIQDRYYRQYAALDALIFKLQNTSDALGSAIQSLVNSQKNG